MMQKKERERDDIKVILTFSEKSEECEKNTLREETVRQEIRELLLDMLREHIRKDAAKDVSEEEGAL